MLKKENNAITEVLWHFFLGKEKRMSKKKQYQISFFILFVFLSFFFTNVITGYASKGYNIKVVPEEKIGLASESSFGFDVTFLDADGQFKQGSYSQVFQYLKHMYRYEIMPNGKQWSTYDSIGDIYDEMQFAYNLLSMKKGSIANMRANIRDILYYDDLQAEWVFKVQDLLLSACAVGVLLYWCASLAKLSEDRQFNKHTVLKSIIFAVIAMAMLLGIKHINVFYCGLNNSLLSAADVLTSGISNPDGLDYYTLEDIKEAAKQADASTITESQSRMHATVWNLEFGTLLNFITTKGVLIILRAIQILFLLNLVLLPITLTDLPYNHLRGMGGNMLLNILSLCFLPPMYFIIFAIGDKLQAATNVTELGSVFVGTFVIPLSIIPIILEARSFSKIITTASFAKIQNR